MVYVLHFSLIYTTLIIGFSLQTVKHTKMYCNVLQINYKSENDMGIHT